MSDLPAVDAVAAAVLLLALLRGLWIGAVRELFSLAGLAAAVWLVRGFRAPAGAWLEAHAPFQLTDLAARLVASIGLAAGALFAAALLRRLVHRGVREAGLRVVDRLAGAGLGLLEGAVVVLALVFGLTLLLGRDDEALAGTRSLAAFQWVEAALGEASPAQPGPGAPAPRDRPSGRARG